MRLLAAALVLAGLVVPFGGSAHRLTERGNRYYETQEYEPALQAYTEAQIHAPEAPELYYDIGNVLYRQEDYAGAEEAFARALGGAAPGLAARASFNLGNAQFRQQRYEEAARSYRRSLEIDPSDTDAKRNLELALRAVEAERRPSQPRGAGDREPEPSPAGNGPREPGEGPEGGAEPPRGPETPGEQPQPAQRGRATAPERMNPREAQRLLDTLASIEREALRRQAESRERARASRTREDW
jgi:Ca-activated chloride channel family protein